MSVAAFGTGLSNVLLTCKVITCYYLLIVLLFSFIRMIVTVDFRRKHFLTSILLPPAISRTI